MVRYTTEKEQLPRNVCKEEKTQFSWPKLGKCRTAAICLPKDLCRALFYHTHGEKSLRCAKDSSRQKIIDPTALEQIRRLRRVLPSRRTANIFSKKTICSPAGLPCRRPTKRPWLGGATSGRPDEHRTRRVASWRRTHEVVEEEVVAAVDDSRHAL